MFFKSPLLRFAVFGLFLFGMFYNLKAPYSLSKQNSIQDKISLLDLSLTPSAAHAEITCEEEGYLVCCSVQIYTGDCWTGCPANYTTDCYHDENTWNSSCWSCPCVLC